MAPSSSIDKGTNQGAGLNARTIGLEVVLGESGAGSSDEGGGNGNDGETHLGMTCESGWVGLGWKAEDEGE